MAILDCIEDSKHNILQNFITIFFERVVYEKKVTLHRVHYHIFQTALTTYADLNTNLQLKVEDWSTILVNGRQLCVCSSLEDKFVTWSCEPNTHKWHCLIFNGREECAVEARVNDLNDVVLYSLPKK